MLYSYYIILYYIILYYIILYYIILYYILFIKSLCLIVYEKYEFTLSITRQSLLRTHSGSGVRRNPTSHTSQSNRGTESVLSQNFQFKHTLQSYAY
jgi:hypothetical protein